jgi:hypothetical protein
MLFATWLYGEQNTVSFSSSRETFGDVEKSSAVFLAALNKAYGEAGALALFQQFSNTLESSRTEIRQRRWDLSYNPPADLAAYAQAIAKTRWIRSVIVRVRPGHEADGVSGRRRGPGTRRDAESSSLRMAVANRRRHDAPGLRVCGAGTGYSI